LNASTTFPPTATPRPPTSVHAEAHAAWHARERQAEAYHLSSLVYAVPLLVISALWLGAEWYGGKGGVQDLRKVQQERDAMVAVNTAAAERNIALLAEVRDLKAGSEAIEEHARGELGMVKQNEVFYQVINGEDLPVNPEFAEFAAEPAR
jgi:cell division protein FtsB